MKVIGSDRMSVYSRGSDLWMDDVIMYPYVCMYVCIRMYVCMHVCVMLSLFFMMFIVDPWMS